ncbi:hypothetical protein QR680_009918 [Steinernema hermaphroditum]|uniref:Unspecific monooxygenase n=1 Tax=Steinernema hermaphroditum TaxID=289476 RepID=A0AA39IP06_9BILA|nr:hypothetical protein QR680_009918 [Steinernema hermaphroditum]
MSPIYFLIVVVLLFLFFLFEKQKRRLPPGPPPIPLLGNLPHCFIAKLRGKSNVDLTIEWKKKYGNVYTIWLGPLPAVLICDYQTTIDAFVKNGDAHAGRHDSFAMRKIRGGNHGLIFSDGPGWMEQKRFTLYTLRNFGVGRNLMQHIILDEIAFRFDLLDKEISHSESKAAVINPAPFFELLIGSVINRLVAGYRYDESNMDEFLKMKRSFNAVLDIFTPVDFILFSERTYQLPVFKQRWAKAVKPNEEIRSVLVRQVQERKADIAAGRRILDVHNGGDDYIDAYLIEADKRKQNGDDPGSFTDDNLLANLLDLWIAGTDTTISVMLWGFTFLLHNPEVAEKIRKEVFSITKGNRNVELTDKTLAPYVNAVITEILRCSCILNINLFHETTCDTIVGDYLVPKGTTLTAQLSAIVNDDKQFPNPDTFDPERYLSSENKKLEQQVIPFGVGKRACLGESLARAEIFLILTNFMQNYKLSVPEGSHLPSLQQIALDGTLKRTRPFTVKVERIH